MTKLTYHNDELDNLLEEKLNLIQPTLPRDPKIVRQRRNEFIREVKYLQFGKPMFAIAGLLNNKPWQSLFIQRPSFVPFAAAVLLIFGLVFGSVGTVYAAQDSLPNDRLYSIKLSGENLRLALTSNTEARISLLTTYTDRRVQEAINLTLQGQPIPMQLPSMLDAQLDELFALITSLDEASSQEALKGIQIHLRDQDQDMTNAMKGLPEGLEPQLSQLRQMMKAGQHLALIGLENPNSFKNQQQFKYKQEQPISPLSDIFTTTVTITPNVTKISEITVTLTITAGHDGPVGPCDEDTAKCAPFDYMNPFGPFKGSPPVFEDHRGFVTGSNEVDDPLQSSETPASGDPQNTPPPDAKDNTQKSRGKDSGANKQDK